VKASEATSGSAPSGQERRRDLRDKHVVILDAAIKVFADKGYHGSRVSDIAAEAGIAYGLVYHYFKNKEEILETIFRERWSGFLEAIEAIAAGPGRTEDKLLSLAALILNAYRVRADWVKVLVFEIQRSSRFADPEQVKAVGRLFESVAGILREGQQAGELRADLNPEIACNVFLGGLDIVLTSRVLGVIEIEGGPEQEKAYYLEVAKTVVDIFLNGLGKAG
jgi:TetR/AcrR family fatty acid metabolism transcriptional regulator